MIEVLLVEDDPAIGPRLADALGAERLGVALVTTGSAALQAVVDDPPDVVVLDLGLPDLDGADVLRMLRAISAVPIIIASARSDESAMVSLLDAGADDYLTKPFGAPQLAARVRAVLRRRTDPVEDRVVVGGLVVDRAGRTATLDGRPLNLTRLEFDLLAALAARAGEVVTRRQLAVDVWRQPLGGTDRSIDVHVSWLRRKLGETATEPRYLHTVRGVGVKLVDPGT